MKKWLIFLVGIATGIILTIVLSWLNEYNFSNNVKDDDDIDEPVVQSNTADYRDGILTGMLSAANEKPGKVINEKSFKVFQVLTPLVSLVRAESGGYYYGTTYLLVRDMSSIYTEPDFEFYDDQIVNVPKGKVVRMFGTYKYTTVDGQYKTIPRIKIVDK